MSSHGVWKFREAFLRFEVVSRVSVLELLLVVTILLRQIKSWFPCVSPQNVGGNSPGTGSSKQLVKPLQLEDFMLDAIVDPAGCVGAERGAA